MAPLGFHSTVQGGRRLRRCCRRRSCCLLIHHATRGPGSDTLQRLLFYLYILFVLPLCRSAPSRQSAHSSPPALGLPPPPSPAGECRVYQRRRRPDGNTHTHTRGCCIQIQSSFVEGNTSSTFFASSSLICARCLLNTQTDPPAPTLHSLSCTLTACWWEPNTEWVVLKYQTCVGSAKTLQKKKGVRRVMDSNLRLQQTAGNRFLLHIRLGQRLSEGQLPVSSA